MMNKKTMKTFVITLCIAVTMTQAYAQTVSTSVEADLLTKNIWETEQANTQNKEDLISYNAWEYQIDEEKEVIAMGEYTPVAYAADEAEADPADKVALTAWEFEAVTTEADAVAKVAWVEQENKVESAKNDAITQTAWTQKEEYELIAMGEYTPVAYAADDIENASTDSLVKSIWGKNTNSISKEDRITKAIW